MPSLQDEHDALLTKLEAALHSAHAQEPLSVRQQDSLVRTVCVLYGWVLDYSSYRVPVRGAEPVNLLKIRPPGIVERELFEAFSMHGAEHSANSEAYSRQYLVYGSAITRVQDLMFPFIQRLWAENLRRTLDDIRPPRRQPSTAVLDFAYPNDDRAES